jgi:8-amino-7-oxononanoate synthase
MNGQPSAEERLAAALNNRRTLHSFRSLLPADPSFIDFCSNDYLGLVRSRELLELAETEWKRLKEDGTSQLLGSGGSRLLAGNSPYAEMLENELAAFYRAESGLLFNSGYAANTGIFSAIPQRGDTILYDEFVHASVRDGIRLSAAKSWSFRHNDLAHLEALLQKAEGTIYVTAEAVYSMDGDEAPLEEMVALCEKYGAALVLDEAHSNGLYGEKGAGLAVAKGLHERLFARVMTFGKAPGCHGAFIVGSRQLRDYLVNFSRPFIYSTALPLHDLAVVRCSVAHFSKREDLRRQLFSLVDYFRNAALAHSIPLTASHSAIQAVIVPGNENARKLAAACREKKLDVRAILSPTVPEGKERLRIILHSFNSEGEVDDLVKIIGEIGKI